MDVNDSTSVQTTSGDGLVVTVRYWASARAAAGRDADELVVEGPLSLADVLGRIRVLHDDQAFSRVVEVCSVLVDDRPASSGDPERVSVAPGETVQLLPPFAGG